jgi:PAS domain S-box-containing protein
MTTDETPPPPLRIRAEERLASGEVRPTPPGDDSDVRRLLHELQVHQVELELQNQELLQTQDLLDAERARYFDLYEQAPVGYCTLDARAMVLEANSTAARLLGVPKQTLVHEALWRFVLPADRMSLQQLHREIFEGADTGSLELRMSRPDGALLWVHLVAGRGWDEQIGGVVCRTTWSDITARRLAEQRLAERESVLADIMEATLAGSWDWDLARGTEVMSPALKHMLGLAETDLDDRPEAWRALAFPEDLVELDAAFDQHVARRGLTPFRAIVRFRHASGDTRWALRVGRVVAWNEHGEPLRMLGCHVDITTAKQAELATAALERQLQQAQKMEVVGRLAGGVAHDFNNMLGVILGRAELALAELEPAHPLTECFEEIRGAALRSASLTRQLLSFARRDVVRPRLLDLNETLRDMLRMLERLIGEDIRLTFTPGSDLWPVSLDPTLLDQILANLCVNARDAIAGHGLIEIETENRPGTPDRVCLSVRDTGGGMDAETLAQIFEPFFTTKEVGKGTGLGLSVVYGAVKQCQGHIEVESTPGRGTRFRILWPRHLPGETPRAVTPPRDLTRLRGRGERVLVVEDEPMVLRLVTSALRTLGYTVFGVERPSEALAFAASAEGTERPLDLLVADVVMPEMNGRDLARRLHVRHPRMRRLFMSGYTDVSRPGGDTDTASEPGLPAVPTDEPSDRASECLHKPFTTVELSERVRALLDRP